MAKEEVAKWPITDQLEEKDCAHLLSIVLGISWVYQVKYKFLVFIQKEKNFSFNNMFSHKNIDWQEEQ